jgi:2-dehydropantoate 2-reductase
MRVAIVGAGSLGSLFGGLLDAAHDVVLVGRDPHISAVRERGLAVTGVESFTASPAATTDATGLDADLAIVTVKSYDTETAARELATGDVGAVVSLQNGLGNEATLAATLNAPVVAGTTSHGAVRDAPGSVTWNGAGGMAVGPWDPRDADGAARKVGEAMREATVPVEVIDADGIRRRLWRKLAVNAAINPVTALADVDNGALGHAPGAALVAPIAREVAATARAAGVDLDDETAVGAVEDVVAATAENESSMRQDVRDGARTEIDAINGHVVRRAAELGVAVPTNRALAALVRAWEAEHGSGGAKRDN